MTLRFSTTANSTFSASQSGVSYQGYGGAIHNKWLKIETVVHEDPPLVGGGSLKEEIKSLLTQAGLIDPIKESWLHKKIKGLVEKVPEELTYKEARPRKVIVTNSNNPVLRQLDFWHSRAGDGFYKSSKEHKMCCPGDALVSETHLSRRSVQYYKKDCCKLYASVNKFMEAVERGEDVFEGKPYASVYDRHKRHCKIYKNPLYKYLHTKKPFRSLKHRLVSESNLCQKGNHSTKSEATKDCQEGKIALPVALPIINNIAHRDISVPQTPIEEKNLAKENLVKKERTDFSFQKLKDDLDQTNLPFEKTESSNKVEALEQEIISFLKAEKSTTVDKSNGAKRVRRAGARSSNGEKSASKQQIRKPKKRPELSKERWELARKLDRRWKEGARGKVKIVALSVKMAKQLLHVFYHHAKGSWEAWCRYVDTITGNDFLMGNNPRGWEASLYWMLTEAAIAKWFKEIVALIKLPLEVYRKKMAEKGLKREVLEVHKACLDKFGPDVYASWIESSEIVVEGGVVVFNAVSEFARERLEEKCGLVLRELCSKWGKSVEVRIKDLSTDAQSCEDHYAEERAKIVRGIEDSMDSEEVKKLRRRCADTLGVEGYNSWMREMKIVLEGGVSVFKATNEFAKAKVEEKYGRVLEQLCDGLGLQFEMKVGV